MGNAVKQGGMSVKGALFLITAVGIAALIISVKGTSHKTTIPDDDDLYENIVLSVVFTPEKRTKPITVQAHVEGVRVVPPLESPNEYLPLVQSPWNHVIRVPKGAQVSLYSFQTQFGAMDCMISNKNGVIQPSGHGHRRDPGSIRCYANRAGG